MAEVICEFSLTPKEMLQRLGVSQYEAETSRILEVYVAEDMIKVRTSRKISRQPQKARKSPAEIARTM